MEEDSKPVISNNKSAEKVSEETKKTDESQKPKENEQEKPVKADPPKKDKMEIDPKVLKDLLSRTEKMKQQIKELTQKNISLTTQLDEKTRLLLESNKIQTLSQEVSDSKNKALQQILEDTSSKNEEITNKLKDAILITDNLKRDKNMISGEMKYFTEKYKDEFPKDRRITEQEAQVKRLQSDNEKLKNESKASQIDSSRIIQENNQKIMDQQREDEYKDLIKKLEDENLEIKNLFNDLHEKHTNETEELLDRIDNLERENNVQSKDLLQTKEELEGFEESYDEFYNGAVESEKKLKSKNKDLKEENTTKTANITEINKRNKNLEEEVAKILHKLRSMPRSGGAGYADKNEKIIVESLSLANNELTKENRRLERDSKKYEMMSKEFENIMNFRQKCLMIVIDELIKLDAMKFKELRKNLKEEEDMRIYNARNNKSHEDLKELIERIMVQNIELKKESALLKAKAITKKVVVKKTVTPAKQAGDTTSGNQQKVVIQKTATTENQKVNSNVKKDT